MFLVATSFAIALVKPMTAALEVVYGVLLWARRPAVEAMYADRASLGHARDLPEADRIDVPFEQILENRFIIGSPEECVQEIKRYEAQGIETIIMRVQWPGMSQEQALDAIRLMGREVIPQFV